MEHTPKKTCDCAETSCPKGCTKQHTHKTFFCETCNPPDVTPKEEEIILEITKILSRWELPTSEVVVKDILDLIFNTSREAIAERDEEIKKIVKNIPTRCRICEKTGVNCYGECECSYEDKGYIKKTDVLLHLTQE